MTATSQTELPPDQILAAAKAEFKATPHPLLPWFTDDELLAIIQQPGGPQELQELYREREQRIYLASEEGYQPPIRVESPRDPLTFGFELAPHWKDCDELQKKFTLIYCAGGKRATKSERAAKRVVKSAMRYPNGVIWCFQDNQQTSIATQQKLIWKYLPPEVRALNGKQDRRKVYNVNYSLKNGFADGVLVLPNRTAIYFLTYNQEVTDYQGWEIGAPVQTYDLDPEIPNLGAWPDENMTLEWLETIMYRATTRNAKVIWTFSTTDGITTAIKEVLGPAPKTIQTRPAELLAGRVNVPGLPAGHMPYIQHCARANAAAIYFHSDLNPFGDNYANVKALCQGKPSRYIEENAYGYARDVMNKAFPLFGESNVIKRDKLPAKLTRYMFTDPGDASRNWATLWVGVASGGAHYIYRDWPDAQTYGEWAVPSKNPKQADGDRGPAQRPLGLGIEPLANEWLRLEAGDEIFERFIDPRAASNEHITEHGGTNLYHEFAKLTPPMIFTPWSGVEIKIGLKHVENLLYWNPEQPLCWPMNAPKLYVCEDCLQVIWCMGNYTGTGGDKAGGKDFADLLRAMGLADLQFYESNEMKSHGGGRGY